MPSFLGFLHSHEESVVFVRIDNPDMKGLSLSWEALAQEPRAQLVWMACSGNHGVDAFSYGADAYLLLPATADRISDVMLALEHKRKHPFTPSALLCEEEI
jgi:DNA-binding LytR/AlgR family response regulator